MIPHNGVMQWPTLSIGNEFFKGNMDYVSITEWLCTSYDHRLPELCQKYQAEKEEFSKDSLEKPEEIAKKTNRHNGLLIFFVILVVVVLGFLLLRYGRIR